MNHLKFGKLGIDPSKIVEQQTIQPIWPKQKQLLQESAEGRPSFLLPRIEAIHAGATRNNTRYLADKLRGDRELKSGVFSWVHPYNKPVIYNHDVETKSTGRVQSAAFAEFTQAGRPGIIVVPKITDPEAIDGILGERLMTVSIGATTDSVTCSICGTDIIEEGYCGHMKGEVYNDEKCEWIAGNLWFDELSWVNVPADPDAMIVDTPSSIYLPTVASKESTDKESAYSLFGIVKESAQDILLMEGELDMTEEQIRELQEAKQRLEAEVQEAKAKQEEAEQALAAAEAEKKVAEDANNALTADIEELKTKKEALETASAALETELGTTKESLTEKEATLAELEAAKTELEEKLATKEAELEEQMAAGVALAQDVKEAYADVVIEMRERLHGEVAEGLKEDLLGRELTSLKDAFRDDLKLVASKEQGNLGGLREQTRQGQGNVDKVAEQEQTISLEDIFGRLLSVNN